LGNVRHPNVSIQLIIPDNETQAKEVLRLGLIQTQRETRVQTLMRAFRQRLGPRSTARTATLPRPSSVDFHEDDTGVSAFYRTVRRKPDEPASAIDRANRSSLSIAAMFKHSAGTQPSISAARTVFLVEAEFGCPAKQ
jgi:hypothetical protein